MGRVARGMETVGHIKGRHVLNLRAKKAAGPTQEEVAQRRRVAGRRRPHRRHGPAARRCAIAGVTASSSGP